MVGSFPPPLLDVELTGTAPDTAVIAQMACDGRPEASQTFQMAGDYLGQALASILKVADVRVIRVGGGVSAAWDCFAPALLQRLDADLIPALRGEVEVQRIHQYFFRIVQVHDFLLLKECPRSASLQPKIAARRKTS